MANKNKKENMRKSNGKSITTNTENLNGNKLEKVALSITVLGFLLLLTVTILFIYGRTFSLEKTINSELFGQIGDFTGGIVGSLWGLAGVILFYIALKTQSSQLNLQRQELNVMKNEVKNQNKYTLLNLKSTAITSRILSETSILQSKISDREYMYKFVHEQLDGDPKFQYEHVDTITDEIVETRESIKEMTEELVDIEKQIEALDISENSVKK